MGDVPLHVHRALPEPEREPEAVRHLPVGPVHVDVRVVAALGVVVDLDHHAYTYKREASSVPFIAQAAATRARVHTLHL